MSEKSPAAFVGLGVMGYPMAGHLAAKGHPMRVYNRTFSKSVQWVQEHGISRSGSAHPTPAEAAEGADYVMTCVGNDDDLRSVVLGDTGVFAGMMEGAVLIDHTTTSAVVARELAEEAEKRGLGFLDAPVSGGQAGAESGVLTIMVGGDVVTFDEAESVMKCYGKTVMRMGDAGAGQLTKMVNQICIAGLLQGLSEGLHFAERAGLDVAGAVEVIAQGAAQSWQMNNRASTMIAGEFDFGFAVDWMRKDLGIAIEAAQAVGAAVPVTELVDRFYADVQELGGRRWDTSSLIQRLRAQATD